MLRLTWLISLALGAPEKECVEGPGYKACGYHCVAQFGSAKCAATPEGVCHVSMSNITCWDPPADFAQFVGDERPTCVERFGKVACGFGCVAEGGDVRCGRVPGAKCVRGSSGMTCGFGCVTRRNEVRCASTPLGVCIAGRSKLACYDPPRNLVRKYGAELPRPECLEGRYEVACGYDCMTSGGKAKCSSVPGGTCRVVRGRIECDQTQSTYQ